MRKKVKSVIPFDSNYLFDDQVRNIPQTRRPIATRLEMMKEGPMMI